MKCHIPEISWHNRQPVLSVDFQILDGKVRRLATAGTDSHVLIWHIKNELEEQVNIEVVADLTRHDQSVNVVRFSPAGDLLASGDDDGHIFIWKKIDKPPSNAPNLFKDQEFENKENWTFVSVLRGHVKDVYDLCWSMDGNRLISGSVDNSAIIWDVHKGKNIGILSDHRGFVQGVAWDPLDKLVATLCSDRCCRVYSLSTQRVLHNIHKANLLNSGDNDPTSAAPARPTRLFHDDTLKSFCRRLTFSPDGELLITPAGTVETENENHINVTYVFSRHNFNKPVLYFPTMENYTTVVRCCPVMFHLRSNCKIDADKKDTEAKPWEINTTLFKLPYRIIFAVATQNSVIFYDTQQQTPFGRVTNIHFTRLTDMSWSDDGRTLVVSSTDGYCSFITFEENELGVPYDEDPSTYLSKVEVINSPKVESPVNVIAKKEVSPTIPISVQQTPTPANKKRIALITLFSPKLKSSIKVTSKVSSSPGQSNADCQTIENDRMPEIVDDTKIINPILSENAKVSVSETSDNSKIERIQTNLDSEPMEIDDIEIVYCKKDGNVNQRVSNETKLITAVQDNVNSDTQQELLKTEMPNHIVATSLSSPSEANVSCGDVKEEIVNLSTSENVGKETGQKIDELTSNLMPGASEQLSCSMNSVNIAHENEAVQLKLDIKDEDKTDLIQLDGTALSPLKVEYPQVAYTSPQSTKPPRRVKLITLSTPPKTKSTPK